MGYFSAQLRPRPLEPPYPVRLWEEPAGWRLTWAQPPPGVSAVQITRRSAGDGAPGGVMVTVAAQRRWALLSDSEGDIVAVAWVRGTEIGPPTLVAVTRPTPPTAPKPEGDLLSAIDKALHENEAKVGIFGLFDL